MVSKLYKRDSNAEKVPETTEQEFSDFWDTIDTIEKKQGITPIMFQDKRSGAYYVECHMLADIVVPFLDMSAPLDPDEQPEYKANRALQLQHKTFLQMLEDARGGRQFSDIIIEYNRSYKKELPLKVLGGQHRSLAIQEAVKKNINLPHGFKVYFSLSVAQRNEVTQVSNTNIALPMDLLDRMQETLLRTGLRDWCQKVGLLSRRQDFADRKNNEGIVTVRIARSFIVNFFEGKKTKYDPGKSYIPYVCKSSGGSKLDPKYEKIIKDKLIWQNKELLEAGKNFAELHRAQMKAVEKDKELKKVKEHKTKAITPVMSAAWALLAGLLVKTPKKSKKLYSLKSAKIKDPLAASLLSRAKHHTDPDTYRGIGARISRDELGRAIEVFIQFVENDKEHITVPMIDVALKSYHAKNATREFEKSKSKL